MSKSSAGDDKRQITVCVASSLHGDMLPLQLIFAGKTERCLPPRTQSVDSEGVHLTYSENHWSSQKTMQEWVKCVLLPYAHSRIQEHKVSAQSRIILVLDVWAVHKSAEFRQYLSANHSNISLVYVPANCTSKLQVADVILQRPFKHGIKLQFNEWAAKVVSTQIQNKDIIGLTPFLRMSHIKPLILEWCITSWRKLKQGSQYIKSGWHSCCISLFDVMDPQMRQAAVKDYNRDLEGFALDHIPKEEERAEANEEPERESDNDADKLDLMKKVAFGARRTTRKRNAVKKFGGGAKPLQIDMQESGTDSDANGMG